MEKSKSKNISRRNMLKKIGVTGAFVIPTLMTFSTRELRAQSSGGSDTGGIRRPPPTKPSL